MPERIPNSVGEALGFRASDSRMRTIVASGDLKPAAPDALPGDPAALLLVKGQTQ
jgi:hypothetical protein